MRRLELAFVILLSACGGSEAPFALDGPVKLVAAGKGTGGVQAQITGATVVPSEPVPILDVLGGEGAPGWTSLTIQGLALTLRTIDGRAWLDEARLPLDDVKVYGAALPATGVQLRNLALRMQGPTRVAITRAGEDSLSLTATMGAALEWQLELDDGTLYPLGNVPLYPLDVHFGASRSAAGTTTLSMAAFCSSGCGGIPDLFSIEQFFWMASGPATVDAN